jgi:hypothetical protein
MAKIYIPKEPNPKYGYIKASRWIKINCTYVTKRHQLFDYAEPCGDLIYFRHKGKLYALGQFYQLNYPIMIEDEEGKLIVIGSYDYTEYYKPYFLEVDEYCENVRLWEEVVLDEYK